MIELLDVWAPYLWIRVYDLTWHLDHAIFLQQVFVIENGIFHNLIDGYAHASMAKNLLESRYQDETASLDLRDIKLAYMILSVSLHHDGWQFLAKHLEDSGV